MAKKGNKVAKKVEKKSSFNWIAVAAVLAIVLLGGVYYMNSLMTPNVNDNGGQNPLSVISGDVSNTVSSGSCRTNSQCYITHCKGQEISCVNVTQLSKYSSRCDNYLDWIVDKQDSTECACVQNSCTMRK